MQQKVLVVDDEADVLNLLSYNLSKAGYKVLLAANGAEAVESVKADPPDALILDLMMPGLDGMGVCRILRSHQSTASIPILMLTARSQTEDRIRGLENGADDYVTKPFSPREVVLRVQALLRRSARGAQPAATLSFGPFTVDALARRAAVRGQEVDLTETEFRLLTALIEGRGQLVSREHLLRAVWGYKGSPDTRTVDTHIRRLRDKLGADAAALIETVRGYGYRITLPDREPGPEE